MFEIAGGILLAGLTLIVVGFSKSVLHCGISYPLMVFYGWNWRGNCLVFVHVPGSFLRISCSRDHRHCDCWFRLLCASLRIAPWAKNRQSTAATPHF